VINDLATRYPLGDQMGVYAGESTRNHAYRRHDDLGGLCYWCLADCEAPAHWLPYEMQKLADRMIARRCEP
jgi:hypothetical protein